MSSGEAHPKAATESITIELLLTWTLVLDVRIYGRFVGVLVRKLDWSIPWSRLVIWDWQLGTEIFVCSLSFKCFVSPYPNLGLFGAILFILHHWEQVYSTCGFHFLLKNKRHAHRC